jgi:hypothetical protein
MENTHSVTVIVCGNYPHGQKQHAKVEIAGDGSLDHVIDAFRAALVAAGFSVGVAQQLDMQPNDP